MRPTKTKEVACSATMLLVPGGKAFGARIKQTVDSQPLERPSAKTESRVTHLAISAGYSCGALAVRMSGAKKTVRSAAMSNCALGEKEALGAPSERLLGRLPEVVSKVEAQDDGVKPPGLQSAWPI
eukprot:CAMPEP_0115357868 /NCGR_PEP_ID=MMETSP0270-20121206/100365_1 /TAXON_ID=71861 /ORGANISM="Scrippsiella trochoidea, Strain CCMP3099" /LENGTH=125 /DNA_ID=CAMNT_0002780329 /DNA_START=345 /DNA_END=723 /DNA_ORIENTATION=+